jgi:uncharacterized protein with ParB-like and HNH nuclease domain
MALLLNAEQKELLKIFKIEEQYIIPEYQRPYSWDYEQCFQLFTDIVNSFKPYDEISKQYKKSEDYFIGNIIIAKSEDEKDILEVIDGQQRLTTLFLMIKILSVLEPQLTILKEILEKKDWMGKIDGFRIVSKVFETNDGKSLETILSFEQNDFEKLLSKCYKKDKFITKSCHNLFEQNSIYFYKWLKDYKQNIGSLQDFIKFLLNQVYLLPIELSGKTLDEAKEKALTIFETINNRGMNLEDADIFKAKLYKKAERISENKIFIEMWNSFRNSCSNLKIEVDDAFRYYMHIIRGKEGITSSEINLRKFFSDMPYSPFRHKKYKEIMEDLFKIIEVLEIINSSKPKSKFIQLIDIYTNQYPLIVLISYIFKNGYVDFDNDKFIKNLIRYIYFQGSTTKIKFETYNLIKAIFKNIDTKEYFYDVDIEYLTKLGNLKNGYTLLGYYLKNSVLDTVYIDKIVTLKDKNYLVNYYNWNEKEVDEFNNSLGNFVVLDIAKKNLPLEKKVNYWLENSKLDYIKYLNSLEYDFLKQRDIKIKQNIVSFFKGKL